MTTGIVSAGAITAEKRHIESLHASLAVVAEFGSAAARRRHGLLPMMVLLLAGIDVRGLLLKLKGNDHRLGAAPRRTVPVLGRAQCQRPHSVLAVCYCHKNTSSLIEFDIMTIVF